MISILCPRYFLWFSEIPELCGNFPVFPLFIPLPRHVVVHCFFLLRYSFFVILDAAFHFSFYSAVKWLLPRKIFLLQGNLFDALVSRQRFDYFRTFVLPSRFLFLPRKISLMCGIVRPWTLFPCAFFFLPLINSSLFFYCRVAFYCLGLSYALSLFAA